MKFRILSAVLLAAGVLLLWTALVQAYTADIQAGEIVINEVMWGPEVSEYRGEWFEIKNVSSRDLDLGGCTVTEEDNDSFTISSPTTVTAGSYFVFCRKTGSDPSQVPDCDYPYNMNLLDNTGGSITITCGITLVDAISFESSWPAGQNDVSAMAFNLRSGDTPSNADALNDQSDRWCDASSVYTYTDGTTTDLGTPGEKNDVCTGWEPNVICLSCFSAHPSFSLISVLLGIGMLALGVALWAVRRRYSTAR